ncbi:hypothetical protein [Endozoicomonas numazuensis]|nr:hypothetical protein [Endozoicomonas numazuensis]
MVSLVAAIPVIGKVIDKIFPDVNKTKEAKAELTLQITVCNLLMQQLS